MLLIAVNILLGVVLYKLFEKVASGFKGFLDGFPRLIEFVVPLMYFFLFSLYVFILFNVNAIFFLNEVGHSSTLPSNELFEISILSGAILTLWLTLIFSLTESYKKRLATRFVWIWRRKAQIQLPQFFIAFSILIGVVPNWRDTLMSTDLATCLNEALVRCGWMPSLTLYQLDSIALLTAVSSIFIPLFWGHIRLVNGVIDSKSVTHDYFDQLTGVKGKKGKEFYEEVWRPGVESFYKQFSGRDDDGSLFISKWLNHIVHIVESEGKVSNTMLTLMKEEINEINRHVAHMIYVP